MAGWSQGIMEDFGYVGIAFLMLIENLFPPIPSEVVLPLAGSATTSRELGLVLVIVAATVGSLIGALALYWAGAALGRARMERFTKRHGRWLTLAPKDLERAESWFERHGGKAVLVCRFIPGLRSLISVPAGVVRMKLARFLALSALGTVIWCTALVWAGRSLGQHYERASNVLDPVLYAVLGILVVTYLVRVVRWRGGRGSEHA